MKVRLTCTLESEPGKKVGEYGDVLESPKHGTVDQLKKLVAMGSAVEVEAPTKKSERDL